MVRTIDRYVTREVTPPFLLALLILTFLLVLPPVMEHLEKLLAKGVSWTTAGRIIWTAVPQAAGLTIPMSLLVGLLVGLGRLSADRESVALLACGVSPYRLLRPVAMLGVGAGLATLYVMLVSIPDANQTFRELTFEVVSKRIESDIHPRVFFEDFPGWVLYARDEPDPGTPGWKDLIVTRTDDAAGTQTVYLARRGRMVINRAERRVHMVLDDGNRYSIAKDGQADVFRFPGSLFLTLNPESVFSDINILRGLNEKTIPELRKDMADKIKGGLSPHPEIITIQQRFSIPAACLAFALVGLALGMSVARDGKLAGFVVGIGVIFAYYIIFLLAESWVKGYYANAEAVKKWAIANPVLRDESGTVGKAYGATNTPNMFVIDKAGKVVYAGAIDNSPDGEGKSPQGGKLVNYVDAALGDIAAGRAVQTAVTKPYGCSVKYGS